MCKNWNLRQPESTALSLLERLCHRSDKPCSYLKQNLIRRYSLNRNRSSKNNWHCRWSARNPSNSYPPPALQVLIPTPFSTLQLAVEFGSYTLGIVVVVVGGRVVVVTGGRVVVVVTGGRVVVGTVGSIGDGRSGSLPSPGPQGARIH